MPLASAVRPAPPPRRLAAGGDAAGAGGGLGVDVPAQFRFSPGMGLAAALRCFELSLAVLQTAAAVRRVADEMCADAAGEGVTTLEIRFAPQLHGGASPAAIVEAAAEGVAGRAGLILCGLYGEDPSVLETLVGVARSCPAVVGIDLAGGPSPAHPHRLRDYARPFSLARDARPRPHRARRRRTAAVRDPRGGPSPARAAHRPRHDPARRSGGGRPGSRARRDHRGLSHLEPPHGCRPGARGAPAAPPAGRRRAGDVCTDNTLFSDVDAPGEYRRAAALPGLDDRAVEALAAFGHAAAFPRRG